MAALPASEVARERVRVGLEKLGVIHWSVFPHPEHEHLAGAGYDGDSPLFMGRTDAVDLLVDIQRNLPTVLADVDRKDRWRMICLNLAAMLLVKQDQGTSFCTVCGMVNAHLPTCTLHPFLVGIRDLALEERRELRL